MNRLWITPHILLFQYLIRGVHGAVEMTTVIQFQLVRTWRQKHMTEIGNGAANTTVALEKNADRTPHAEWLTVQWCVYHTKLYAKGMESNTPRADIHTWAWQWLALSIDTHRLCRHWSGTRNVKIKRSHKQLVSCNWMKRADWLVQLPHTYVVSLNPCDGTVSIQNYGSFPAGMSNTNLVLKSGPGAKVKQQSIENVTSQLIGT